MKRIYFEGAQCARIDECAMPQPQAGEVLVKVSRCALCGSDLKLWHHGEKMSAGHEVTGVVEQAGHPLNGKRCIIYMPVYCGQCPECQRGDTHLCITAPLVGWNRAGGYAEYLTVPEKCLVPIPDDIPDDLAPLLLDAVSTPAHGLDLAEKVLTGKPNVLITGAGIIGLGALIVCKDRGYTDITMSEPRENRQQRAAALGAKIRKDDDTSRYGLVLECSGNLKARQQCIELVDAGGAVVLLGENDTPWCMEENKIVRRKDFYMIRSFYFPQSDILKNADVLRRNRDAYKSFVDGEVGFTDFQEGFSSFASGELTKPMFNPAKGK